MAVYAAQIDRMDQGIGRILEQLEATGKASNTIVIFLSDNGGCAEGGPEGLDHRKNGLPPGGVDSISHTVPDAVLRSRRTGAL